MEIKITYEQMPLCNLWIARWDIYNPDKDDLKFAEEISKEMDLNMISQLNSKGKLW